MPGNSSIQEYDGGIVRDLRNADTSERLAAQAARARSRRRPEARSSRNESGPETSTSRLSRPGAKAWSASQLVSQIQEVYQHPLSGLDALGHALRMEMHEPAQPKLRALLLGPRACTMAFVEWYVGSVLPVDEDETPSDLVFVKCDEVAVGLTYRGRDAVRHARNLEPLLQVIGAENSLVLKIVPAKMSRGGNGVELLVAPEIEGALRGRSATQEKVLSTVRNVLIQHSFSVRSAFRSMDSDGNGELSTTEFINGLVALGIGIGRTLASQLASVIDVDSSGSIDYEEFLATFQPPKYHYEYSIEEALKVAAGICTVSLSLLDSRMSDSSGEFFSYRLLQCIGLVKSENHEDMMVALMAVPAAESSYDEAELESMAIAARSSISKRIDTESSLIRNIALPGTAVSGWCAVNSLDWITSSLRREFTRQVVDSLRNLAVDLDHAIEKLLELQKRGTGLADEEAQEASLRAQQQRQALQQLLTSKLSSVKVASAAATSEQHQKSADLLPEGDLRDRDAKFLRSIDKLRTLFQQSAVSIDAAFNSVGSPGQSVISANDFVHAIQNMEPSFTVFHLQDVFVRIDVRGMGFIDKEAFALAFDWERSDAKEAAMRRAVLTPLDADKVQWMQAYADTLYTAVKAMSAYDRASAGSAQSVVSGVTAMFEHPQHGLVHTAKAMDIEVQSPSATVHTVLLMGNGSGPRHVLEQMVGRQLPLSVVESIDPTSFTAFVHDASMSAWAEMPALQAWVRMGWKQKHFKGLGRPSKFFKCFVLPEGGCISDGISIVIGPTVEGPGPTLPSSHRDNLSKLKVALRRHGVSLLSVFRSLDRDCTGCISKKVLIDGLDKLESGLSKTQVGYLVAAMVAGQNAGQTEASINYEVFLATFRPAIEYKYDLDEVLSRIASVSSRIIHLQDVRAADLSGEHFSWKELHLVSQLGAKESTAQIMSVFGYVGEESVQLGDGEVIEDLVFETGELLHARVPSLVQAGEGSLPLILASRPPAPAERMQERDAFKAIYSDMIRISDEHCDSLVTDAGKCLQPLIQAMKAGGVSASISMSSKVANFVANESLLVCCNKLLLQLTGLQSMLTVQPDFSPGVRLRTLLLDTAHQVQAILKGYFAPLSYSYAVSNFRDVCDSLINERDCGLKDVRAAMGSAAIPPPTHPTTVLLAAHPNTALEFVLWYFGVSKEHLPEKFEDLRDSFIVYSQGDSSSTTIVEKGLVAAQSLPQMPQYVYDPVPFEEEAHLDDKKRPKGKGLLTALSRVVFPSKSGHHSAINFVVLPHLTGVDDELASKIGDNTLVMMLKNALRDGAINSQVAFRAFDLDGNGRLSVSEIREAVQGLGIRVPSRVISEFMKAVDTDMNGELDIDEFMACLTVSVQRSGPDCNYEGALVEIAKVCSGTLCLLSQQIVDRRHTDFQPRLRNAVQTCRTVSQSLWSAVFVDAKMAMSKGCVASLNSLAATMFDQAAGGLPAVFTPNTYVSDQHVVNYMGKLLMHLLCLCTPALASFLEKLDDYCLATVRGIRDRLFSQGSVVVQNGDGSLTGRFNEVSILQSMTYFVEGLQSQNLKKTFPWADGILLLLRTLTTSCHDLLREVFMAARPGVICHPVIEAANALYQDGRYGLQTLSSKDGLRLAPREVSPIRILMLGDGNALSEVLAWWTGYPNSPDWVDDWNAPEDRLAVVHASGSKPAAGNAALAMLPAEWKNVMQKMMPEGHEVHVHLPGGDTVANSAWVALRAPSLVGGAKEKTFLESIHDMFLRCIVAWKSKIDIGSTWRLWLRDILQRAEEHLHRHMQLGVTSPDSLQRLAGIVPFIQTIEQMFTVPGRGLKDVSRSLGMSLGPPSLAKKSVLILGAPEARKLVISQLTGASYEFMGRETDFQIFVQGPGRNSSSSAGSGRRTLGQECVSLLPTWKPFCRMSGMEESLRGLEQEFPGPAMQAINIVEGPVIDGSTQGRSRWQDNALDAVYEAFKQHSLNVVTAFKSLDLDKDGVLGKKEFTKGLQSLDLGFSDAQCRKIFRAVDLNSDGFIHFEEFCSAFRRRDISYPYSLEDAVLDAAQLADLIFVFIDVRAASNSGDFFSVREFGLYRQLAQLMPGKFRPFSFVPGDMSASDPSLKATLQSVRELSALWFDDPSALYMQTVFGESSDNPNDAPRNTVVPDRLHDVLCSVLPLADSSIQTCMDQVRSQARKLLSRIGDVDSHDLSQTPIAEREVLLEAANLANKTINDTEETCTRSPNVYCHWLADTLGQLRQESRALLVPPSVSMPPVTQVAGVIHDIELLHNGQQGIVHVGNQVGMEIKSPPLAPVVVSLAGGVDRKFIFQLVETLCSCVVPIEALNWPINHWGVLTFGQEERKLAWEDVLGLWPEGFKCPFPTFMSDLVDGFMIEEAAGAAGGPAFVFIITPNIDGNTAASEDWLEGILSQVRQRIHDGGRSLLSLFQTWDADRDGVLSLSEFCKGVSSLSDNSFADAEMKALFHVVNYGGNGSVNFDEFMAAFRQIGTKIEHDFELVMKHVVDASDLFAFLFDVRQMDMNKAAFSVRLVSAMNAACAAAPDKVRIFPTIPQSAFGDEYLLTLLREAREALGARVYAGALRSGAMWLSAHLPRKFDAKQLTPAALPVLHSSLRAVVDARAVSALQALRTNLALVVGAVSRWQGWHDKAVKMIREVFMENTTSLRSAFRALDRDGDGKISKEEFIQGMEELNLALHASDIVEMTKALGMDRRNLDYEAFLSVFDPALIDYSYDPQKLLVDTAAEADLVIYGVSSVKDKAVSPLELATLRTLLEDSKTRPKILTVTAVTDSSMSVDNALGNHQTTDGRLEMADSKVSLPVPCVICRPGFLRQLEGRASDHIEIALSVAKLFASKLSPLIDGTKEDIQTIRASWSEDSQRVLKEDVSTVRVVKADRFSGMQTLSHWLYTWAQKQYSFPFVQSLSKLANMEYETTVKLLGSSYEELREGRQLQSMKLVVSAFLGQGDKGLGGAASMLSTPLQVPNLSDCVVTILGPHDDSFEFVNWLMGSDICEDSASFQVFQRADSGRRLEGEETLDLLPPRFQRLLKYRGLVEGFRGRELSTDDRVLRNFKLIVCPPIEKSLPRNISERVPSDELKDLHIEDQDMVAAGEYRRKSFLADKGEEDLAWVSEAMIFGAGLDLIEEGIVTSEDIGKEGKMQCLENPLCDIFVPLDKDVRPIYEARLQAATDSLIGLGRHPSVADRDRVERIRAGSSKRLNRLLVDRHRARVGGHYFCTFLTKRAKQLILTLRSVAGNSKTLPQPTFMRALREVYGDALHQEALNAVGTCLDASRLINGLIAAKQAAAEKVKDEKDRIQAAINSFTAPRAGKTEFEKGEISEAENEQTEEEDDEDQQAVLEAIGNMRELFNNNYSGKRAIEKAFLDWDTSRTGRITRSQFIERILDLDIDVDSRIGEKVFTHINWDSLGLGHITLFSWNKAFQSFNPPENSHLSRIEDKVRIALLQRFSTVKATFLALDADSDGQISIDEFAKMIHRLHLGLTSAEIMALGERCDSEQKGAISFRDFFGRYTPFSSWRTAPQVVEFKLKQTDGSDEQEDAEQAEEAKRKEEFIKASKERSQQLQLARQRKEKAAARAEAALQRTHASPYLQMWLLSKSAQWTDSVGSINWMQFIYDVVIPLHTIDDEAVPAVLDAIRLSDIVLTFFDPFRWEVDDTLLSLQSDLFRQQVDNLHSFVYLPKDQASALPAGINLESLAQQFQERVGRADIPMDRLYCPKDEGLRQPVGNNVLQFTSVLFESVQQYLNKLVVSCSEGVNALLGQASIKQIGKATAMDAQNVHNAVHQIVKSLEIWGKVSNKMSASSMQSLSKLCVEALPNARALLSSSSPISRFIKSMDDIHNNPVSGLHDIAQRIGVSIATPQMKRQVILLVGNNGGPRALAEAYTGSSDLTILSAREDSQDFSSVMFGADNQFVSGGDALDSLWGEGVPPSPSHTQQLRRLGSIKDRFTMQRVSRVSRGFELLTFVRPPMLTGSSTDNEQRKDPKAEAVLEFKRLVHGRNGVLTRAFEVQDPDKTFRLRRNAVQSIFENIDEGVLEPFSGLFIRAMERHLLMLEGTSLNKQITWTAADEEALATALKSNYSSVLDSCVQDDSDGDGFLTQKQLHSALKRLRWLPDKHFDALMQRSDMDFVATGMLDFNAFFKPYEPQGEEKVKASKGFIEDIVREALQEKYHLAHTAFRALDRKSLLKIPVREFSLALKRLHLGIPDEMIEMLVKSTDADKDGFIQYKEFMEKFGPNRKSAPSSDEAWEVDVAQDASTKTKTDAAQAQDEAIRRRQRQMYLLNWMTERARDWLDTDGRVKWDVLLADCRPDIIKTEYDLDSAMLDIGEVADHIILFTDARSVDPLSPSFHSRELAMFEQLHTRFRPKLSVVTWVSSETGKLASVSAMVKDCASSMAVRLKDRGVYSCPALFESSCQQMMQRQSESLLSSTDTTIMPDPDTDQNHAGMKAMLDTIHKQAELPLERCVDQLLSNCATIQSSMSGDGHREQRAVQQVKDWLRQWASGLPNPSDDGIDEPTLQLSKGVMQALQLIEGGVSGAQPSSVGGGHSNRLGVWGVNRVVSAVQNLHDVPRVGLHFLSDSVGIKLRTPEFRRPVVLVLSIGCDGAAQFVNWMCGAQEWLSSRRSIAGNDVFIVDNGASTAASVAGQSAFSRLPNDWHNFPEKYTWLSSASRLEALPHDTRSAAISCQFVNVPSVDQQWEMSGFDPIVQAVSLHFKWIVTSLQSLDPEGTGFVRKNQLVGVLTSKDVGISHGQLTSMLEASSLGTSSKIAWAPFINAFKRTTSGQRRQQLIMDMGALADSVILLFDPVEARYSPKAASMIVTLRKKFARKIALSSWIAPGISASASLVDELYDLGASLDALVGKSASEAVICSQIKATENMASSVEKVCTKWAGIVPTDNESRGSTPVAVDDVGVATVPNAVDILLRRVWSQERLNLKDTIQACAGNVQQVLFGISNGFISADVERKMALIESVRVVQQGLMEINSTATGPDARLLLDMCKESLQLCSALESSLSAMTHLQNDPKVLKFAQGLMKVLGGGKATSADARAAIAASGVEQSDEPSLSTAKQSTGGISAITAARKVATELKTRSVVQKPSEANLQDALLVCKRKQAAIVRSLKIADTSKTGAVLPSALLKALVSIVGLDRGIAKQIVSTLVTDKNGRVNFKTFIRSLEDEALVDMESTEKEALSAQAQSSEVSNTGSTKTRSLLASRWDAMTGGRAAGPLPPSGASGSRGTLQPSLVLSSQALSKSSENNGQFSGAETLPKQIQQMKDFSVDDVTMGTTGEYEASSEPFMEHQDFPHSDTSTKPKSLLSSLQNVVEQVVTRSPGPALQAATKLLDSSPSFTRTVAVIRDMMNGDGGLAATSASLGLPRAFGSMPQIPESVSRSVVLLLGNGVGKREVAENFLGIKVPRLAPARRGDLQVIMPQDMVQLAGDGAHPLQIAIAGNAGVELAKTVPESAVHVFAHDSNNSCSSGVVLILACDLDGRTATRNKFVNRALSQCRVAMRQHFSSLLAAFQTASDGTSGVITPEQFESLLHQLSIGTGDCSAREVFEAVDLNGDGVIEFEEFLAAFRPGKVEYAFNPEAIVGKLISASSLALGVVNCHVFDGDGSMFSMRELAALSDAAQQLPSRFVPFIHVCEHEVGDNIRIPLSIRRTSEALAKRLRRPFMHPMKIVFATSPAANKNFENSINLAAALCAMSADCAMRMAIQSVKFRLAKVSSAISERDSAEEVALAWCQHLLSWRASIDSAVQSSSSQSEDIWLSCLSKSCVAAVTAASARIRAIKQREKDRRDGVKKLDEALQRNDAALERLTKYSSSKSRKKHLADSMVP